LIIVGNKNANIKKIDSSSITQITKGYKTHTIIGGEFAISLQEDNIAFKTLLGSCVAIMFYDHITGIKSMNHFLLPHTNNSNNDMKYGLFSVEAMLNEMFKLGVKKENLKAKIAGGADIIKIEKSFNSIGFRNVEFARDFCKSENIDIVSEHTRGNHGRLVLFTNSFETYIKINKSKDEKIAKDEYILQNELSKPILRNSSIELF
jgi:chemotaxis protein CheD